MATLLLLFFSEAGTGSYLKHAAADELTNGVDSGQTAPLGAV